MPFCCFHPKIGLMGIDHGTQQRTVCSEWHLLVGIPVNMPYIIACDSLCYVGYKKSHCTPGALSTVGASDNLTITTTRVTHSTSSKQKHELSQTELGFAIGVPTGLVAALMIIIVAVLRRRSTKRSVSSRKLKIQKYHFLPVIFTITVLIIIQHKCTHVGARR